MFSFGRATALSISKCGATAGSILRGSSKNNKGLRVQVCQGQLRGHEGAIKGRFVILDSGENKHSPFLESLVQQLTDADAVLGIIRREHQACLNVVNANSLVLERP